MGCYETPLTSPCGSPLYADVAPLPCTDGLVNIDDLLLVIMRWGDCPTGASSYCAGDITTDATVNIDDLLAVINAWSNFCVGTSYDAWQISSVEDCMDVASHYYDANTNEWNDFVNKCVHGLCEARIIDCD